MEAFPSEVIDYILCEVLEICKEGDKDRGFR